MNNNNGDFAVALGCNHEMMKGSFGRQLDRKKLILPIFQLDALRRTGAFIIETSAR